VPQAPQEAPKAQPTTPDFQGQTAGDIIRQAARDAARGGQSSSGDYGAGAIPRHPGIGAGVDVLSDTLGVDFGPYLQRVIAATYRSWDPLIPESVRPPIGKRGKVGIEFKILPDGSVKQMILRFPSGDVALDRAAWGGITGASPYPPLPKEFKGPYLALRFAFLYNINPDQQ
jgi:TonB family protein